MTEDSFRESFMAAFRLAQRHGTAETFLAFYDHRPSYADYIVEAREILKREGQARDGEWEAEQRRQAEDSAIHRVQKDQVGQ